MKINAPSSSCNDTPETETGLARTERSSRARWSAALLAALLAGTGLAADAADLERRLAKRIHDRIAGVPPTEAVLDAMELEIVTNGPVAGAKEAARTAMLNPNFYNVTLKNFAAPWTNRDRDIFVPLNDYTATVIGLIRDSDTIPFTEVLSGDIVYVGNPALGLPPYSMTSNAHYEELENQGHDLAVNLQQRTQSSLTDLPSSATAGIMTTRAAAEAFFIAGTNRAMFRFTLLNHLCTDLEPLQDTSRPADRIRQDVSRSPGGDSRIFLNRCVGCHAGMDPMAQAFAYYNFDETAGRIVYTGGMVQPKYHINESNFKYGYVTPDDHWDNYWRFGQNSALGWDPTLPGSGDGAKELGVELASSDAFARCQSMKAFQAVCLRDPTQTQLDDLVDVFVNQTNYDMKEVFAEAAVACMGD
jgi:hypothetical protein